LVERRTTVTEPHASSLSSLGGGSFFKVGRSSDRQKSIEKICDLNWQL